MNNIIKPKLIDYSLLKPKKSKIISKPINIKTDIPFLINVICILILGLGILGLYERYINNNIQKLHNQNMIIELNQYVKEYII